MRQFVSDDYCNMLQTRNRHGVLVCCLLVLLVLLDCSADLVSASNFDGRICIGTNGRMSVPSNREHHYRNLRDRYMNCTYVDGNLELTWLQDENFDLSFLKYIREVTGYVLISHVDVKRIVLPSLQIIRGRTLFKLAIRDENFALLVTLSKMHTLEMPALRDILEGSVGLFNNYNLCHITTIAWDEIMSDPTADHVFVYNFTQPERRCVCHESCKRGCWGEGEENCQKFSKITCSPQCHSGRCFDSGPRDCCHLFCAGGCTGPTQSDCLACKNFYDDGECKQECPAMHRYNTITYSWETNPNGKYAYGATCVKNCPDHLLRDNGACVRSCPPKFQAVDGECVPCNGACPKTCSNHDIIHAGNLKNFEGCTVIEGSITILDHSFNGFQQVHENFTFGEMYPEMLPADLEVFATLKEITGFINIQASHPEFKNLNFLRNLESIGGRDLTEYFSSIYIVKSSLESLNLKSLKRIRAGKVYILENKHLCFAENITWTHLMEDKDSSSKPILLQNNKHYEQCKEEGLVCHEECSDEGCWGEGSEECLSCQHYQLNDTCVNNCNLRGTYEKERRNYGSSPGVCSFCHEECKGGCTGPHANHCFACNNVRDGPICLPRCPESMFNHNGECRKCHANCDKGCNGPDNNIGENGCVSCNKVVVGEIYNVEYCLAESESCPEGYFSEWVPHQENGHLKHLAGKRMCRRCHSRCKNCSGFGFHTSVCHECLNYKRGEQCEDQCPEDHYADEKLRECFKCSVECNGCTGPTASECKNCRNYRVYDNTIVPGTNESHFNCSASCPADLPYKIFPENRSDPYCGNDPLPFFVDEAKLPAILIGVVGFVCLFSAFCAVFCYVWWKRNKTKEAAMKMTMNMMPFDDNEPLKPTNIKPNLTKLRIVKEVELRKGGILGYGAFGSVYKGVWVPDGENVKIPVAIKVLREDTGTNVSNGSSLSKEILEEAYIMATVDHPNLLQLLAVCMTNQIMMVTQLMPLGCLNEYVKNNKANIGSKPLLNYCTQIAKGMAYLEERHLVHRDLAARNVLVQTPTCVKITDFGLAKLLPTNEDEYKAPGGKMPIKWLALECIQHRIFTHKSDVWAFGVTVWEILTYGGKPYDEIPAREVPDLLEKGERLPQPLICTIDVYMIMIRCWTLEGDSRPKFKELVEEFSVMSRDPGRYLVIPGDKLMRLPSYTPQDEKELVKTLSSQMGGDRVLIGAEEYLQPKYGMNMPLPTSTSNGSEPNTPMKKHHGGYEGDMGSDDCFENSPSGDSDVNSRPPGYGWVGNVRLDLPVDDDDYLMPSPQQLNGPGPSNQHYMDVTDRPRGTQQAASFYHHLKMNGNANNLAMDNPEYHMMNKRNVAASAAMNAAAQHAMSLQHLHRTNPAAYNNAVNNARHRKTSMEIPQHVMNVNSRRPSQRSSQSSSQPQTPTDPYFFPSSTSDPNFAGLPRSPTSNSMAFRLPSHPTTPTDPNFRPPNGSDHYFPWVGGRPLDAPPVSNPNHQKGHPYQTTVQPLGVPVLEHHSRLPSYTSSNGSSGPNSNGSMNGAAPSNGNPHYHHLNNNISKGAIPRHSQPSSIDPSHEYYNDLSREYSSLNSNHNPNANRSETTV